MLQKYGTLIDILWTVQILKHLVKMVFTIDNYCVEVLDLGYIFEEKGLMKIL